MKKILNSNVLKIIAISAMLLDHVATAFFSSNYALYFTLRIIGRVCAPIMFYSVAKGYFYTKDKFKYGVRLFTFAVISQIPYSLFIKEQLIIFNDFNVIFTLFLGYLCLVIFDKIKDKLIKYSLIILCIILSYFCDWGVIGVIFVLLFWIFKDSKYKYIAYSLTSICYLAINFMIYKSIISFIVGLGLFLVIPLIYLDNGKKGKYNLKYLFYLFYPLHLLILFFIKTLI